MTWQDAMAAVVARTGVERYRWLCSDDNPREVGREAYRRLMLRMAGVPEPPPPEPIRSRRVPLDQSIRAVRIGLRNCFYATREGCGCSGATCHYLGRVVTLPDCLTCLPPSRKDES